MEDARKAALKRNLRQLNVEQLQRIRNYEGDMCQDEWNYRDGAYCPLAVALELDKCVKNPSHEVVYAILALMGFEVNSTRNVPGEFYRTNRHADLMVAVDEVLDETAAALSS